MDEKVDVTHLKILVKLIESMFEMQDKMPHGNRNGILHVVQNTIGIEFDMKRPIRWAYLPNFKVFSEKTLKASGVDYLNGEWLPMPQDGAEIRLRLK